MQAEPIGFGIEFEKQGLSDLSEHGPRLVVRNVLPGGAANADGKVKVGDKLIAVDGVAVSTMSEEQLVRAVQGSVGSVARLLFIPVSAFAPDGLVEDAYEVMLTSRPVQSYLHNEPPPAVKQPQVKAYQRLLVSSNVQSNPTLPTKQPPPRSPALKVSFCAFEHARLLQMGTGFATVERSRPPSSHGETAGVGLLLVQKTPQDDIFVKDIVADGAAAHDGRISVGDQILSIDGELVVGLDLNGVWER